MENNNLPLEITNAQRAQVLTQALPYIKKYYNKLIVIKYGGNAMINEQLKEQVMEDIVLLSLIGVKVVLVHGGGPEITDTLKKIGKESEFVNGLRVTDKETADVVQMVLAGKINKTLVNMLGLKGARAIGISGLDAQMIKAEMKDSRLGYVGRITEVDVTPINDLLKKGYIPVVSTIACDSKGNVYNINADTAAAYIAGGLQAERLFTMTDIEGILRDKDDKNSLISCIDIKGAEELFETGVISGGMIPKVECCIEAIHKGVKKVVILDGRVPHELLIEMLTNEGAGTMVVRDMAQNDDD
ncbi:MAG: acetylglutamate kinase [Clostridia bacterium]|nr:acetylglutamate kinase [Clostridia bacterium]